MSRTAGGALVAIVDDHAIAAEGLVARLGDAGFTVVGAVPAVEAVDDVVPAPEIIICDLRLPGRRGADAVAYLVDRGFAVLATSGIALPEEVLDAITAGARGFQSKTAPSQSFVRAVAALAAGGYYISPELANHLIEDRRRRPLPRGDLGPGAVALLQAVARGETVEAAAADLAPSPELTVALLGEVWDCAIRRRRRHAPSPRERQVLQLVGDDLSHKELAVELGLSPSTLPTLLERIRTKYLALHPEADTSITPLAAARRWAAELGIEAPK